MRLLEIAIWTKFVKLVLDLSIFRCKAFQIYLNLYEMNLTFNMLNYKPTRTQQVFLNFSRDLKRKLWNSFVTEKIETLFCRENIGDINNHFCRYKINFAMAEMLQKSLQIKQIRMSTKCKFFVCKIIQYHKLAYFKINGYARMACHVVTIAPLTQNMD